MERCSDGKSDVPSTISLCLDDSAIKDIANVMVALANRPCPSDDDQGTDDDQGSDDDSAESSHAVDDEPPRRVVLAKAPRRRRSRRERERKPRLKVNQYRGAYRDRCGEEGCRYYAQITIPTASCGIKRQRLALGYHTTAEVLRLSTHSMPTLCLAIPNLTRPFESIDQTQALPFSLPRCRRRLAPMTGPQCACMAIEPS